MDKNKVWNNENDINKCIIKINEKVIPFNYKHKFESKYTINYLFKNDINNTAFMFYRCSSLISIYLSNFNISNVTNMRSMFEGCSSLTY